MYSPTSLTALLFAAALICAACNDSGQKTETTSDSTQTNSEASTPPATEPAPVSTIITTPQNILVVMHKVANFEKWKMAYDGHDTARVAAGIRNYVIGRGLRDSNMVLVAMKVDDTAKAMAFGKNPALKSVMQKAGVIGTPRMNLITLTYQDTATIASPLRSLVMFTVKDWDAWFNSFQSGNQLRTDNGVAVRNYGYADGDKHRVRVVTAMLDSAKAVAYYQSDTLKKRMAASGMTGTPERFLFRVVHRY